VAYPQILHWLQAPYCHVTTHCSLYVTGPLDGLSLRIHVATYAGLFLASPVILWQVWRFVTPGLRKQEKRYAVPFVAASLVLFAAGASLALVSLPHALAFLGSVGGPTLHQIYDPNKYVGLVLALMAVFGLTFEFPVILVALQRSHRAETPSRCWPWRCRSMSSTRCRSSWASCSVAGAPLAAWAPPSRASVHPSSHSSRVGVAPVVLFVRSCG